MKKVSHIVFLCFVLVACERRTGTKNVNWQTMEIFVINGKNDTVNCIDGSGLKQGKWIPSPLNELKDTVYYFNDSLVKK